MAESKKTTDKVKTVNTRTTETVKNPKASRSSGAKTSSKGNAPAGSYKNTKTPGKVSPEVEAMITSEKKKKRCGTVLAVISCVLASLILVYCVVDLSTPLFFADFYKDAEKSVKIPGLNEAFIPQGFAYCEDLASYLVCGYMSNSEQSRIYVVDGDGAYKEIRLKKENGDNYTGHAGGISCNGGDVYISNNKKIFYLLEDRNRHHHHIG